MDKNIENESSNKSLMIKELANKYNVPENDMEYIITKYGSIEKLYNTYKSNKMHWKDIRIAENIIRNTIDIDENPNRGYEVLYRFIKESGSSRVSEEFHLFSSEQLKRIIEGLKEQEQQVLDKRFGLTSGDGIKRLKDIGAEMGISSSYARNVEIRAAAKIHRAYKDNYNFWDTQEYITGKFERMSSAERNRVEEIKKDIQLQNGTLQENLAKLNAIRSKYDSKAREELTERILAKQKVVEQQKQEISQINAKDRNKKWYDKKDLG